MSFFNFHDLTVFITDIGESALLCTIVLTGTIYLLIKRCPREALALAVSFFITGGLIALLKIGFMTCGNSIFGIRSPSGHTSLSVAVFLTCALLLVFHARGWMKVVLPAALVALAAIIAFSRMTLGFHSTGEVIVGILTGIAVAAAIWFFILRPGAGRLVSSRLNIGILVLLMVVAACLAYGMKFPAEKMITEFAAHLKKSSRICAD